MKKHELSRRDFVKAGTTGAMAMLVSDMTGCITVSSMDDPPLHRPLGQTGHDVFLFSLGGQASIQQASRHDEALAIINRAIDLGVNYIDTSASYGQGVSETHIGEVMATRRDEVFLATKTDSRDRDGALLQLEESLNRLQTDHIDLWQLHNLSRHAGNNLVLGDGGAIEALIQARDENIVRFLGVTGHFDPDVLVDLITRFDFDCILMALNPSDAHVKSFQTELLSLAVEKGMGIIGMKIAAQGRLLRDGGITSMREAMHYVLTLPVSTVIIGCDNVEQVEGNVAIASEFWPLSVPEMARLEGLTASYAAEASYYNIDGSGI